MQVVCCNWQQFPFFVRIEFASNYSPPFWVAGALINESFALTNAKDIRFHLLQFAATDLNVSIEAGMRSDSWGSCRQSRQKSQVR